MADVVEVWHFSDDVPPGLTLAELYSILDAQERQRADAFLRDADRSSFVVAHAAVRLIIGERLGGSASELTWEYGPHGKPALCGTWAGVEVNLSHSGGHCLVAVAESRPVGVDIQRMEPGLDVIAMAKRYFTSVEAQFVQDSRDADKRAERFAQLWTRKEAVTKAAGARLIREGVRASVLGDGGIVAMRPESGEGGRKAAGAVREEYRVVDLSAPDGYRAAVALAGPQDFQVESRVWDWAGSSALMSPKSRATPEFSDGTVTGTPGS